MSQIDMDQLARWRTLGARHSEEVVELAGRMVKGGRLGEQEWTIREQLAIAALDLGRTKLATEQLDLLLKRFPASPRVMIIQGLRYEALGDIGSARKLYSDLLLLDETDISAHQRSIALSLSTSPASAINDLVIYLETFYSDASAWSLLAQLYADLGMYGQSLTAMGHLMLLQTWDSDAVRRAGETAYTLGDLHLALKHYLRAVEMETEPSGTPQASTSGRKKTRSWWGVKMTTKRLLECADPPDSSVPEASRASNAELRALDELATERLLAAGGANMDVRRKVLAGGGRREMVR